MSQTAPNPIALELLRRERRKRESAARTVPYLSFILTHVVLVLFLGALYLVDRLVGDPKTSITLKIVLVVVAVLFQASEWAYAIISSRRWRKDIQALEQAEEEQYRAQEEARQKAQEAALATFLAQERQKNFAVMFSLQQQRRRGEPLGQTTRHSIPVPSFGTSRSRPQTPFRASQESGRKQT